MIQTKPEVIPAFFVYRVYFFNQKDSLYWINVFNLFLFKCLNMKHV